MNILGPPDPFSHISEWPRRETALDFPEGMDRAYAIVQGGTRELLLFSRKGRLFIQERGRRVRPLNLLEYWSLDEAILACQGGTWVLSSALQANGIPCATVLETQAHADVLTAVDLLIEEASIERSSALDRLKKLFQSLI